MSAISAREFFGGAVDPAVYANGIVVFNSPITLDFRWRFWRMSTTTGSLTVSLPANTTPGLQPGSPILVVANVGSTSFTVRDTELFAPGVTVAAGRVAYVRVTRLSGVLRYGLDIRNYTSY